jgi:hypothetical protein
MVCTIVLLDSLTARPGPLKPPRVEETSTERVRAKMLNEMPKDRQINSKK